MRTRSVVFASIAALCAPVTLFFAYYGARLVHAALTFAGEGSLGHVGMYIGAGLFPVLAVVFGSFTFFAWRAARRAAAGAEPVR